MIYYSIVHYHMKLTNKFILYNIINVLTIVFNINFYNIINKIIFDFLTLNGHSRGGYIECKILDHIWFFSFNTLQGDSVQV